MDLVLAVIYVIMSKYVCKCDSVYSTLLQWPLCCGYHLVGLCSWDHLSDRCPLVIIIKGFLSGRCRWASVTRLAQVWDI